MQDLLGNLHTSRARFVNARPHVLESYLPFVDREGPILVEEVPDVPRDCINFERDVPVQGTDWMEIMADDADEQAEAGDEDADDGDEHRDGADED